MLKTPVHVIIVPLASQKSQSFHDIPPSRSSLKSFSHLVHYLSDTVCDMEQAALDGECSEHGTHWLNR